jgi:hypothetical protein
MAKNYIFAPWFFDRQRGVLRVKSVTVSTDLPWAAYYRYVYLNGVGTKLSQIPRHICGNEKYAVEQLERTQRLINFVDASGFRPIAAHECPNSHKKIAVLEKPDHVSYWLGPLGEPVILMEPYASFENITNEISSRNLTGVILPHTGIYSGAKGKTVSLFLALPENADCIGKLAELDLNKPLSEVHELNWFEALNLGKGHTS